LYCLPSLERSESLGVVLKEAMAYGNPCVASDIPGSGVTSVNQHGTNGIHVHVGDPVALANACNRILSSPEEHARLSAGARLRFLGEFTEDVSVSRMLKVYEMILEDQKT
jgi:glycosyltransferase involved in cell wall biosynthesis